MAIQYVFLALLVLSAQGISEAKSFSGHDERGLVEEVEKVIQELVALAKYFLENSMKIIQELYDQLQGAAKEEFEKALEQLKAVIAEVQANIQKILEEIHGLGEAAQACVKNEEENIIELANDARKNMAECRNALMTEANKVFNDARATVIESIAKVQKIWNDFTECSGIICKIGVMGRIPVVIDEIKQAVQSQIAAVQRFVNNNVSEYVSCNQNAVNEYVIASNEIKGRILTCIDNIQN